jgi:hypothetical protein
LLLTYVLDAELSRIRVPDADAARMTDRLWEHTCFELFVRESGSRAYCEFNFSPSGEWAAYAFEDYRKGGPLKDYGPPPRMSVRRESNALELDAEIDLNALPGLGGARHLSIALSAVIEDLEGTHSYWALAHAPGKPDFHHPNAFALNLTVSDA